MNHEDVHITYHQFGILADDTDWPDLDPPANGLVSAAGSSLIVHTGIHTGPVSVTVAILTTAPARLDQTRPWQAIAEVSMQSHGTPLRVRSLEDETKLPALNPGGAGTFRVRVHATGRDTDIDGTSDVAVEFYLLQIWPAPTADARTYRAEDRYGQELRDTPSTPAPTSDEPDGVTFEEWV